MLTFKNIYLESSKFNYISDYMNTTEQKKDLLLFPQYGLLEFNHPKYKLKIK